MARLRKNWLAAAVIGLVVVTLIVTSLADWEWSRQLKLVVSMCGFVLACVAIRQGEAIRRERRGDRF